MRIAQLLFLLGLSLVAFLPQLPPADDLVWLLLTLPLCGAAPRAWPLLGLIAGFAYGVFHAQHWLEQKIPSSVEGQLLWLDVAVHTSPALRGDFYRFQGVVMSDELKGRRLLLTWLSPDPPKLSEVWRMPLKLQRPRGLVNDTAFDYEAWLLKERVHGLGYVLPDRSSRLLEGAPHWFQEINLRQQVRADLEGVESSAVRGALAAVMIGDASQLDPQVWQNLTRTGTNHLFVVSGLHVGMIAGVLIYLLRLVSRSRFQLMLLTAPCLLAYGVFVGFGLPVQRALMMALAGYLFLLSRRQVGLMDGFLLALTLVLIVDPFALLGAGFWLSFGAVAGLIVGFAGWRYQTGKAVLTGLRTQWVALLSTAPLLLCWIGQVSTLSVIANSLLIPMMGVIVLPLTLAYIGFTLIGVEFLAGPVLELLIITMQGLLAVLAWLSELSWIIHLPLHSFGASALLLGLFLIGSALLLLPRGLAPRWLGVLCWLPLFSLQTTANDNFVQVDILDVGQGLSTVITGPQSTLVYDAGPSYSTGDTGQRVVVPVLRTLGRERIDLLITSHGDDDHAGGVASLLAAFPVVRALSSDRNYGQSCVGGNLQLPDMSVRWFAVAGAAQFGRNNGSCILEIETDFARILLPGDIEASSEYKAIEQLRPVDLLVSPHHGSGSSSTPGFLNRVSPIWVVHSSGYMNRFDHPSPWILSRYANRGTRQYLTSDSGAVRFVFRSDRVDITEARLDRARFWYD